MADDPQQAEVAPTDVVAPTDAVAKQQDSEPPRSERAGSNFPIKLFDLLTSLEAQGLDHIVSWAPHGRCFVVRNQEEFVSSILPVWFRQTKFTSFQRQLNIYGFTRLTSGKDKHGYYHPLFLRNDRDLAKKIERHKLKGTGTRKPGNPESEPNFYDMPYIPATPRLGTGNDSLGLQGTFNDRSREDRILAQLLASQGHQQPMGQHDFAMMNMQHPAMMSQDAFHLAAARRAAALAQLQQQQQPIPSSELDFWLAQARLKASMGMNSPGLRMPQLGGGLASHYDPSMQMMSNSRTALIQNMLGLNEDPQQSNDALRRALMQNSLAGVGAGAQLPNMDQQQQMQMPPQQQREV